MAARALLRSFLARSRRAPARHCLSRGPGHDARPHEARTPPAAHAPCLAHSLSLIQLSPGPSRVEHTLSSSPSFRRRSSTSVLPKMESILNPESYCYLGPTRLHSPFEQEDFFDRFRPPHYPPPSHAAPGPPPLVHAPP